MITEDYVSFETAKLLKEKGFDEATTGFYPIVGKAKESFHKGALYRWNYFSERGIAAPTLQMTMKWLREVHKCFIEIKEYFDIKQYQAFVSKCGKTTYCEPDWFHPMCNSYEEACEAAIRYCLENLI